MRRAEERIILLTGATSGLGRRLAEDLARQGSFLFLHGRDRDKGRRVVAEIREATGNGKLQYCDADLASLEAVRRLAGEVAAAQGRLDLLINNAGVGAGPDPARRETSADGFELRFAVNYLAPCLLTRLLLPQLGRAAEEAGEARVVNVASAAQRAIDFGDVMLEKGYDGMRAYAQSKLALIMFTFDLAAELKGTGVAANAVHPASLMDTPMVREWFGTPRTTVDEGVPHVERLAVAEALAGTSGEYFDQDRPVRAADQAYDPEARHRLRELSRELTAE